MLLKTVLKTLIDQFIDFKKNKQTYEENTAIFEYFESSFCAYL